MVEKASTDYALDLLADSDGDPVTASTVVIRCTLLPYNIQSYGENEVSMEHCVCLAIVQTTTDAGRLRGTDSSPGLYEAIIEIKSLVG